MSTRPKIYSAKSAAAKLGKSASNIRALARRHGIGEKIGNAWTFTEDDIWALAACPKPGRPRGSKTKYASRSEGVVVLSGSVVSDANA